MKILATLSAFIALVSIASGAPAPVPAASAAAPEETRGDVKTGDVKTEKFSKIDFVFVEGGTFVMGKDGTKDNEKPPHEVTISSSFYLGRTEVTNAQFKAVMGRNITNPSPVPGDEQAFMGDDLPVAPDIWPSCLLFCNKLSVKDGLEPAYRRNEEQVWECNWNATGYRLPTEAEWEYAARGGKLSKGYIYAGSNNPDEVAWYDKNSGGRPQPVGQKKPNELGLYDMSGNVQEWCWDFQVKGKGEGGYDASSPKIDPHGPAPVSAPWPFGNYAHRERGGTWNSPIDFLRVAARIRAWPTDDVTRITGFRILLPQFASGTPPAPAAPSAPKDWIFKPKPASPSTVTPAPVDETRVKTEKKTEKFAKIDFVFVEGGTFMMGQDGVTYREKPPHPVTVDSFYMSRTEVTQAQWKAVMGRAPINPSPFAKDQIPPFVGDDLPQEPVTWFDALAFCNQLSVKDGLEPAYRNPGIWWECDWKATGYRLATEAEWEYAARGGKLSKGYLYPGSNNPDEVAWYGKNSGHKPHPVGQKKPNELGLYDMAGNAKEWVWDLLSTLYYKSFSTSIPTINPHGPPPPQTFHYVGRGGSWDSQVDQLPVAARDGDRPTEILNIHQGIRLLLPQSSQQK